MHAVRPNAPREGNLDVHRPDRPPARSGAPCLPPRPAPPSRRPRMPSSTASRSSPPPVPAAATTSWRAPSQATLQKSGPRLQRPGDQRPRRRRHHRPRAVRTTARAAAQLIVTGLGMVGAIDVNKSPVSLDQAAPLARMTGEYQPLVVGADSPIKTLDDLAAMYKADPGSVSWGGFALGSPDHLVSAMTVKAFGRRREADELHRRRRRRRDAEPGARRPHHRRHRRLQRVRRADPDRRAPGARHLLAGAPSRRRHPDVQGAGLRRRAGQLARPADQGGPRPRTARRSTRRSARWCKSEAWRRSSKERGWVDMYQDSETFAAFLDEEQTRIGDPRRARPRRVAAVAAGLAVGRALPAYRVATGILEGLAACKLFSTGSEAPRSPALLASRWAFAGAPRPRSRPRSRHLRPGKRRRAPARARRDRTSTRSAPWS